MVLTTTLPHISCDWEGHWGTSSEINFCYTDINSRGTVVWCNVMSAPEQKKHILYLFSWWDWFNALTYDLCWWLCSCFWHLYKINNKVEVVSWCSLLIWKIRRTCQQSYPTGSRGCFGPIVNVLWRTVKENTVVEIKESCNFVFQIISVCLWDCGSVCASSIRGGMCVSPPLCACVLNSDQQKCSRLQVGFSTIDLKTLRMLFCMGII